MQRPRFHFTPRSGWMNDPNGLVFHDGLWHLFFQYHPHSLEWGPMHWGHATSPDLFAWQEQPVALCPDELGTIFSGSAAVCEGGHLVAAFTHHGERGEAQSLAFSQNGGHSFEKWAHNPVLKSERRDFRDPKIWRMNDGWKMLVAAGKTAQLFSSPDLFSWTLESEIPAPFDGWIWECPDLFCLDGQWVLAGSFIVPEAPHETHYCVGEFDGHLFSPQSAWQLLGFGPDDYAAVSWNNAPDERRVLLGWMNSWRYASQTPTRGAGFRGAMTLPRECRLRAGRLHQTLPREWQRFRARPLTLSSTSVLPATPCEIELEWDADFPLQIELQSEAGVWASVCWQPGGPSENGEFSVSRAEIDGTTRAYGCHFAPESRMVAARLVVDAGALSVFAREGGQFGSFLIFTEPLPRFARVVGGAASLTGRIYPLLSPGGAANSSCAFFPRFK